MFGCKPALTKQFFLSTPYKENHLSWNHSVSLPIIIKIILKIPIEIAISDDFEFDCKPALTKHFFLSTPFKENLSWNHAVSLPIIIKIIVKIPIEIAISYDL